MSFLIKGYAVIICLTGLFLMIYDKRQAIAGRRRVRESTLLLIAALGGAAWHKVRKPKFVFLIPLMFVLQAAIIYFLEVKGYV